MSVNCPLCDQSFTVLINIKKHLKTVHAGKCFHLQCKSCLTNFACYSTFIQHLTKEHFNVINNQINEKIKDVLYASTNNSKKIKIDLSEQNINLSKENFQFNNNNESNVLNSLSYDWRNHLSDIVDNNVQELPFENRIFNSYDKLVAKLYGQPLLCRNMVHSIITDFKEFYDKFKLELQSIANDELEKNKIDKFKNILNVMHHVSDNHKTEYASLQYFKKKYYVEPESVHIATVLAAKRIYRKKIYTQNKLYVQMIPIKNVLKHYLELPNVFKVINNFIETMEKSETICSIFSSERWKEIKKKFPNKIVLPITCYGDDFEINNVLGSHKKKNKIHALYCTLTCIPREYSSLLENIFLLQLHKSEYKKMITQTKLYYPAISQIIDLQNNGIDITVNNENHKIYFHFYNLSGDNLEMYSILGFNECFNSNYPCRICTVTKEECASITFVKKDKYRTNDEHANHIKLKSYGVKCTCSFKKIGSFDIFKHTAFDLWHDIYEGIGRYEMADILNELIFVEKCFTFKTLTQRMANYNYAAKKGCNITPQIDIKHIKEGHLIMSAAEMKFLIENLCFFVGDLVPSSSKAWRVYLELKKMCFMILATNFTESSLLKLKKQISLHHKLYKENLKKKLRPKHHFILHYIEMILALGPPRDLSCLRFEGKHKPIIESAKVLRSRINGPKSLAIKHQLQLNHRFLCSNGFDSRIKYGPIVTKHVQLLPNFNQYLTKLSIEIINNYSSVSWFSIYGSYYESNSIIELDIENTNLKFGKIEHVLVNTNCNDVIFLCQALKTIKYSVHYDAYEVENTTQKIVKLHKNLINGMLKYCLHYSGMKMYISCQN